MTEIIINEETEKEYGINNEDILATFKYAAEIEWEIFK